MANTWVGLVCPSERTQTFIPDIFCALFVSGCDCYSCLFTVVTDWEAPRDVLGNPLLLDVLLLHPLCGSYLRSSWQSGLIALISRMVLFFVSGIRKSVIYGITVRNSLEPLCVTWWKSSFFTLLTFSLPAPWIRTQDEEHRFHSGSSGVTIKGADPICTPWFLDSRILHIGNTALLVKYIYHILDKKASTP